MGADMAKTGAERQAEYRAKRADDRRLDVWIDDEAALALDRLTRHFDSTHRELVERLLLDENKRITDTLKTNESWSKYHD